MNIGIIDSDLISRDKHRFPNLASMKISGYYSQNNHNVNLITEYTDDIKEYDKLFLSKVFTDTDIPDWVLKLGNIEYGGTGFYYDKAPPLSKEIEHCMPDYHLYDEWVKSMIRNGEKEISFRYYKDYSIGFLTRGCFRKCEFCVNQNYDHVFVHSPLSEFIDNDRKKICLLDDNFLGCKYWKDILLELQSLGKPFQFKQGLDERLLTDEKCEILFNSKYDGEYIFAFDNVKDAELIEAKLKMIRKYTTKRLKFYVFCGFDRNGKWDLNFWKQDLWDLWKRIEILSKYDAYPYIMRFQRYEESPYRGHYIMLAKWCNQPKFLKQTSFREFSFIRRTKSGKMAADERYLRQVENDLPDLANKYFDLRFGSR